jgi:anti-sigma B factor antagonist
MVQISEREGIDIISLSGKIMGGPEAGEINEKINELIDEDKKNIIIDLSDVDWMNSSGLGILIGAVTTLKNNEGQLALVNISDRIRNLLKITKLIDVFDVHDDFDSAIESMK